VKQLVLEVLADQYAVCQLANWSDAPPPPTGDQLFSLTRTGDEISLVCATDYAPPALVVEEGWRALMVQGPLDFSLVGILAKLSSALAEAQISVFALSTFDTDVLLVKQTDLMAARLALGTVAKII